MNWYEASQVKKLPQIHANTWSELEVTLKYNYIIFFQISLMQIRNDKDFFNCFKVTLNLLELFELFWSQF